MLVLWRFVDLPLAASFFFLGIVAAMGYDMGRETLRAAQLSDDLRTSRQRLDLATHAAKLGLWAWDIARDEIWVTDMGVADLKISAQKPITTIINGPTKGNRP